MSTDTNPIPFNPQCMTVSSLIDTANSMKTISHVMDRGGDAEAIRHAVMDARESVARSVAK